MPSTDVGGSSDSATNGTGPRNSKDAGGADGNRPGVHVLGNVRPLWKKTGVTVPMAKLMFKGALTPTILLAAYQGTAWAEQFSTVGYLIAIMAQLSTVFQPRAKFVQTMLVQVLLISLAIAIALLASYCAVRARISSEGYTGPGTGGAGTSGEASRGAQTTTYNSSASAVVGIWLFLAIYGISCVRAHYPQYTIPCIQFAIITNVAMTYAPQFSTMAQAEALCLNLISAVFTGLAVATGVSLFIFPLTSRSLFFNEVNGLIKNLQGALSANQTYLNSLEDEDMFAAQRTNTEGQKARRSPEAEAVQTKMKAVSASHSRCATNLTFAVREVALGKLGPDDLKQLHRLLQQISIPMVGLSCLSDIFERISEERGWDRSKSFAHVSLSDAVAHAEEGRLESINEWHELIKVLKSPLEGMADVISDGLEHVAITLQLTKPRSLSSNRNDDEAIGDSPNPGDVDFAEHLSRRADAFLKSKQTTLRVWCTMHDIELPVDYFSNPRAPVIEMPGWMRTKSSPERIRIRTQLMILLYVEFLLYKLARRTHTLVSYTEGLRGKLDKNRLVLPGYKRLRKWLLSLMHKQDGDEHDYSGDLTNVYLGQAYNRKKDPDHLPPKNRWETSSNGLRRLARFFSSSESMFAFRVALATMSIAVINLLHVSQVFFTKERLFWAQIMASIAMAPSAGQSLRIFSLRIFGTAVAMVLSIVAWYVVAGNTTGILVFYFLFNLPGLYIILRHPTLTAVGMISTITLTVILGYELQVRKIGVQKAESNGQEYYPIYELAPIRLVTVLAGIFVAMIFSIFPYPITEHSQLRRKTAGSLYLLANYYSTVDETAKMRLRGWTDGDEGVKGSAAQKLAKARLRVLSKCNALLAGMRGQIAFVKYDIPVGGSFPKAQYAAITERIQSILNFMSLISIASTTFSDIREKDDEDSSYQWIRNLRRLANSADLTSQTVTTLLSLLSASLSNAQPLPPHLSTPEPYALAESMDRLDPELLSIRHIAEPGYASFAVIQIALTCMIDDLKELLEDVKQLVGELDFSFHVVSSSEQSGSVLTEIHRATSDGTAEGRRVKRE